MTLKHMVITLYTPHRSDVFFPDIASQFECSREEFSGGYPVYSGLMVCPVCALIWAKLTMVETLGFYEARSIPCADHPQACHPDLRPVAGSLLDNPTCNGYDSPLLEAMPEYLLRREFDLHLKAQWDD